MKTVSAEQALQALGSNHRVYIHTAAAAPQHLVDAMVARAPQVKNVEIVHLHTENEAIYVEPQYKDNFHLLSFFVGPNVRKATQDGHADYIPVFLSEVPYLLRKKILPINVALISVSSPDSHGYVSMGVSVDASLAAVEVADIVIAQVNRHMPRALGDGLIPISKIDYLVEHEQPLHQIKPADMTPEEDKIGINVASLIEDGATLQMGIGAIPNAVLSHLYSHKRLGIHTEMFTDGLIPLVEKGVVTNEEKKLDKDHIVSSFVMGTDITYNFVHDNPRVLLRDVAYVNDVAIIRQQPKMTAINSAIEVDLTGQVCSDSIGTRHYSGVGGQMDFIRGASYSEGGKPIIAIPSVTAKGVSKISSTLKEGAGVVTTRANVHYVVTEYGIANLFGKSLKQRARELINIAHPDHRENLEKEAYDRWSGHF